MRQLTLIAIANFTWPAQKALIMGTDAFKTCLHSAWRKFGRWQTVPIFKKLRGVTPAWLDSLRSSAVAPPIGARLTTFGHLRKEKRGPLSQAP